MLHDFRTASRRFLPLLALKPARKALGAALVALLPIAASGASDPKLETFRREIQPILEKYCYDCHGNGIDKGGVTLDSFETVASLHDHNLWARALRNLRSGIMPPADEAKPTDAETAKVMAWIKRDAFGIDPAKPDPGRVTIRRLNRVEYRNTIRDLIGVDFDTQKEFPADDTGHGFDNIADVLTISPMLLEKYLDAAQTIIGKAVVTKPRMVAEKSILGREFATVKVDTTLPEPPKPTGPADGQATPAASTAPGAPAADVPAPVAAATAAPARATATPPQSAPAANPAAAPITATAQAPASLPPATLPADAAAAAIAAVTPPTRGQPPAANAVPGRGRGRGGQGRGRGGPPPITRPAPTVEGDTVILSYYTPATVAAKAKIERAGKYQVVFDLIAHETYADNLFDLNKCTVILSVGGEKVLEQEFVREGYGKKFEFAFDRDLSAGEHELAMEIVPIRPETPQYRRLRMRINAVHIRGPLAPESWVPTPGYAKYFPRETPADAAGRRRYAREILEKFATRAFRGPVDPVTLDRLVGLAEKIYVQPTSTFETGVAQAMVSVLAAPSFIFREDRTEPLRPGQSHPYVDEHSLASRLSYFLWSSMPDEELLRLAGARQLRANLSVQLRRMLNDPKAQQFVSNFTGQWLQARDIVTVAITAEDVYLRDHPDPEYEEARAIMRRIQPIPRGSRSAEETAAFQKAQTATSQFNSKPKPQLGESLRRAMLRETELTFAHILKEDRSLLELLDSNYTFLNEELAAHYGIEGVSGSELRKVDLPAGSPRGGILTQGTILAVTSNPTRTSPVKRGVFILESVLGTPPAPPPPNIPSLEDAATAEELKKLNLRETLALHAKNPTCNSCHSRMDPLGLALENFNAMGVWRTADMNQPVETAGKLITGESFADVRELKKVLSTSRRADFYHCVAEKLLTYALGRGVEHYDIATVDRLVAQLEASGGRPSVLLHEIINSVPFQQRRHGPASLAGGTPAPAQSQTTARISQTNP